MYWLYHRMVFKSLDWDYFCKYSNLYHKLRVPYIKKKKFKYLNMLINCYFKHKITFYLCILDFRASWIGCMIILFIIFYGFGLVRFVSNCSSQWVSDFIFLQIFLPIALFFILMPSRFQDLSYSQWVSNFIISSCSLSELFFML